VRTDRGRAPIDERPCFKDSINLGEERCQITCPSLQELSDVGTRWRPGAPQVDDAVGLGEAESESLPLLDKGEQPQHVVGIDPIARCSPAGRRHDSTCLIHAKRFPRYPASLQDLADSHGRNPKPSPMGRSQEVC